MHRHGRASGGRDGCPTGLPYAIGGTEKLEGIALSMPRRVASGRGSDSALPSKEKQGEARLPSTRSCSSIG